MTVVPRPVSGLGPRIIHSGGPTGRWFEKVVAPLDHGPVPPAIEFEFVPGLTAPGRPLQPLPGGVCEQGLWVADHAGRAAVFNLHGDVYKVRVHDRIDPRVLMNWVYLPVLRAALWDRGAILIHSSAGRVRGETIAYSGWSGCGKTWTLLAMLEAGADFLSDDWLGLLPDGRVFPVSLQLNLSQGQLPRTARRKRFSLLRGIERIAARAGRSTQSSVLGIASNRLAAAAHAASKRKVLLDEVRPGAAVAPPARLDRIFLLGAPSVAGTSASAAAGWIASNVTVEWRRCAELEGASRFGQPGVLDRSPFPSFDEEREVIASALHGVTVVTRASMPGPGPAARLVADLGIEDVG